MADRTVAVKVHNALRGEKLDPVRDAVLIVHHGIIDTIGAAAEVRIPDDAEVIDAAGLTAIPGFIDAHVHIGLADPAEVVARGVTTVRDLGWPEAEIFPLAGQSRSPDFDGPTIITAGPMLTAPGGYPSAAEWAPPGTALELDGPERARREVARLAAAGVSVIKIALNPLVGPTLDRATLAAVVDETHARELRVTGHIYGLDELEKAVAAGVDELAHVLMSPEPIPDTTIDRMVQHDMVIVPTLAIFSGTARRVAIDNVGRFAAAGGTVVYGTDLGNEGPRPGIDAREVNGMVEAGLEPLTIVAAGTVTAARRLRLAQKGALAPGMDADVVLIDGDPTKDATRLTEVRMVLRRGMKAS